MRWTRVASIGAIATVLACHAAVAADFDVWGIQTFNPAADRYIGEELEKFGQARGVDAEYVVVPANVLNERLAAAFEGGSPPDVFMTVGAQIQYYLRQGLTIPVGSVLDKMRQVEGGIYENVVPLGVYGGEVMALPIELDLAALYVRTDLLAQAGRRTPETWGELRETAKAVQKANPIVQPFAFTASTSIGAEGEMRRMIWSFGGAMFAEDGRTVTFDSPETRAAYRFIADMFFEDRTIPRSSLSLDDAGNNTAYQSGRAAFVTDPPSILNWLQANDADLLGKTQLAIIPKGPGERGRHGVSVSAWVWAASKAASNHDLAHAWLEHFYEPDRYRTVIEKVGGRWLPIYKAMMDIPLFAETPHYAQFKEMLEAGIVDGHEGPPTALAGEVFTAKIVTTVLQRILANGETVEDAVAWGQEQIEALAAKS